MFPLPVNPTVAVLLDANGSAVKIASNIAPLPELRVKTFNDPAEFEEEAANKPFNQTVAGHPSLN